LNNTGGAYATPHCDPLRLLLVGGMGSIGDNLYRVPWGFVNSAPLPDPADAVVFACFNRPEKITPWWRSACVPGWRRRALENLLERLLALEPEHPETMDAH
jgi:hypothetical protein